MLNGLYSAASGMLAQQTRMDMLANDLANLNTTGYKQARIGFRDLLYNSEQGMPVGAGAAVVDAGRNDAEGALQQTGDPLSLAIAGPGFFQVRRSDGSIALTRSGDFTHRRATATSSPSPASASSRRCASRRAPISTSSRSRRTARSPPARRTIGKITLVNVTEHRRPRRRSATTSSRPREQRRAAADRRLGRSQQGYLEASNVDLARRWWP